jgi:hypothetical protein
MDQRILTPGRLEDVAETDVEIPGTSSRPMLRARASAPETRVLIPRQPVVPLPSHPPRAESPHSPHTPLSPPPLPRKSSSSVQRPMFEDAASIRSAMPVPSTSRHRVRKITSSPQIHEQYGSIPATPPPRLLSPMRVPAPSQPPPRISDVSESEQPTEGRRSFASYSSSLTSTASEALNVPSLPERDGPSPTRSAFHDARFNGHSPQPPSIAGDDVSGSEGGDLSVEHMPPPPGVHLVNFRQMHTNTPPPRTSSSLAHVPLRPPPRSSSHKLPSGLAVRRELSPRPSMSSSDPGHSAFVSAVDLRGVSPARPGTSRSDQTRSPYLPRASTSSQHSQQSFTRHRRGHVDMNLQVPGSLLAHALKDVPASPIEFFDAVEAASHVARPWEDDEDEGAATSSTEDYGSVWETPAPYTPSPQPSPRPSPQPSPRVVARSLSGAISSSESLPLPRRSPIIPVSNTVQRPMYFKDTRSSEGLGEARPSTAPSATHQTPDDASFCSSDSSPGGARVGRTPSMLRLDGMLVRHMEEEREAFQRIARASKGPSVRSAAR